MQPSAFEFGASHVRTWLHVACLLAVLAALPACQEAQAPQPTPAEGSASAPATEPRPEAGDDASGRVREPVASEGVGEEWEVAYLGDQRIGYLVSRTDRVDREGTVVLRTRQISQLRLRRFDDVLQVQVQLDTFERADNGALFAFDQRMKLAQQEQRASGRLGDDGVLHGVTSVGPQEQPFEIEWPKGVIVIGPAGIVRNLEADPLEEGESRELVTFEPTLTKVVTVELEAAGWEETELRDGTRRLLRVEQEMFDGETKLPLAVEYWVDEEGTPHKSRLPFGELALTTYRASKQEALAGADAAAGPGVDLGFQTLVTPSQPLPEVHDGKTVTYRLTFADEKTAAALSEGPHQQVETRDGASVVLRVAVATPPSDAAVGTADAEYLAPNGFLPSNDPAIAATAREVAGEGTPWEKVQRLERWVHDEVVAKDFSVGFADAGEVMRTRQGDCTEHAVLLAALCRAIDIPARVAIGLVYIESQRAFGYHMWTEVKLGDAWYPADGTLGLGFVAGGHIKITDSSLKGASAMSTFLPIFDVLGKLRIEVVRSGGR